MKIIPQIILNKDFDGRDKDWVGLGFKGIGICFDGGWSPEPILWK